MTHAAWYILMRAHTDTPTRNLHGDSITKVIKQRHGGGGIGLNDPAHAEKGRLLLQVVANAAEGGAPVPTLCAHVRERGCVSNVHVDQEDKHPAPAYHGFMML
jgi:hypothetical protein